MTLIEREGLMAPVTAVTAVDLAGEEGLEPSHVGIKIRCHDQLGDSPTQVRRLATANPKNGQSEAHPHKGWISRLRHIRPTQPGATRAGMNAEG